VDCRILHRILVGGLITACGLVWLTGCKSSERHPLAKRAASPKSFTENLPSDKIASAHAHYSAGVIHELNEENEAALNEYYQATLDDPGQEALNLEVADKFLRAKQPEKALAILQRASGRPNATGEVYARLGLVCAQLGKTEEAIAANRAAIRKSPTLLSGYQSLFLLYVQNKQIPEALQVLDQASRQSSADAEFLVALSDLYSSFALQAADQKENAHAKGLALLRRADKLNPTSPALRLQLAEGFNSLGDSARAAQLYLDLLKKLPDIPMIRERVHARLTDIYLRTEDRKHASEQLQAIVRDDPTNPQAYYFLGSLALEDNKASEAADYFRKTILLKPDFEQAYYDLAMALLNLRQPGNALETLQQARQKFAQSFLMEFWMGMAYAAQKDFKPAMQHFTAAEVIARATEPKRLNEFFYFQLGAACERSGDLAGAEKHFRKALELAPNFSEAMNYLGYMWADHGTKLEEAKDLVEKAVKLEPKNAAYLDSLGWVFFKLNKFPEALKYVREASDLSEAPDPTLLDHLGDIYAALNQTDKARAAWEKSVSLDPKEAVRKKLQPPEAK
jgi:tetratricopeptide (TPR) repeat protein